MEAGVKIRSIGEHCVAESDECLSILHGVFLEARPEELERLAPHFEVLAGRPVVIYVDKDAERAAIDAEED
jgi:hypothetical protein